jgi:hypothetical protein
LEQIKNQLKLALRRAPFAQLCRAEITAAGLTVITADPAYSRAWGRGWRALRHGLESEATTERLWISPSWEIYERWCFLRVGRLLASTMTAWNWRRLTNPHRWVGMFGDRQGELMLQPTFWSKQSGKLRKWSISKQRVPDLVLTVECGGVARFVILDAKYRASRSNILDAMDSAHVYQDSLRIGSHRPDATLLLIPACGGAEWLENPTFQDEHRVGAHVLSPSAESTLPKVMMEVLGL